MKSKKIKLVALLAIVAVVATVGMSFAYWASGVNNATNNGTSQINIGAAGAVDTTITLDGENSSALPLVPAEVLALYEKEDAPGTYDAVDSIDFEYTVKWEGIGADSATGKLKITLADIEIDGVKMSEAADGDEAGQKGFGFDLFQYTVTSGDTTGDNDDGFEIEIGQNVTITITMTMDEPTKAELAMVSGAVVKFTFTFAVEVDTEFAPAVVPEG